MPLGALGAPKHGLGLSGMGQRVPGTRPVSVHTYGQDGCEQERVALEKYRQASPEPWSGGGREGETKGRVPSAPEQPPQEGVPLSTPAFTLLSPTWTPPFLPKALGQTDTGAHKVPCPTVHRLGFTDKLGRCGPSEGAGGLRWGCGSGERGQERSAQGSVLTAFWASSH